MKHEVYTVPREAEQPYRDFVTLTNSPKVRRIPYNPDWHLADEGYQILFVNGEFPQVLSKTTTPNGRRVLFIPLDGAGKFTVVCELDKAVPGLFSELGYIESIGDGQINGGGVTFDRKITQKLSELVATIR
jgi:hypothetical protein